MEKENHAGHVHFTKDVSLDPHTVHCVPKGKSGSSMDLGLLQVLHTYLVSFDMEHCLGKELEIPPLQTPVLTIKSLRKLDNGHGHHVVMEVKCEEMELLKEDIKFENANGDFFTLAVHAKLMASHLGTPALKSGIKLLSKSVEVSSDAGSDWQGF